MRKLLKKDYPVKRRKRWMALLMSLCLTGTMFPASVAAQDSGVNTASVDESDEEGKDTVVKMINLDPTVLRPTEANNYKWDGSIDFCHYYIYFGDYEGIPFASTSIGWRVLNSSPDTQSGVDNCLFLDCDYLLWGGVESARFDDNSNVWTESHIREFLNNREESGFLTNSFTNLERAAMATTTLKAKDTYSAGAYNEVYREDKIEVYDVESSDTMFCLSGAESDALYDMMDETKQHGYSVDNWWLRSVPSNVTSEAVCVRPGGGFATRTINDTSVVKDEGWGMYFSVYVSPAFNLNLDSVLFASSCRKDKTTALRAVYDADTYDEYWKLTLIDPDKTVRVSTGESVNRQDETITVPYTYSGDEVSQVSVMITDKAYTESDAEVLYYGALQDVSIGDKNGMGTFALPTSLANKTCGTDYYAYIIAEEINQLTETDYASVPAQITIPDRTSALEPETVAVPVSGRGLGVSVIADPTAPTANTDAWKGSYAYFGMYDGEPLKYRVLDRCTTEFGTESMLLDCDSILGDRIYDEDSGVWATSDIRSWLNSEAAYEDSGFLTGSFTIQEQTAIAASTKEAVGATDGDGYFFTRWIDVLKYSPLSGEKIFLLDVVEMTNESYGYSNCVYGNVASRGKIGGTYNCYWTRTQSDYALNGGGNAINAISVAIMSSDGYVCPNIDFSDPEIGVSPALNVKLSSVLFSTALTETNENGGTSYKLTLLDDNITVAAQRVRRNAEDKIGISYMVGGEHAAAVSSVAVMVLDKEYTAGNTNNASLVAYEKLTDEGNGWGSFLLTDDMKNNDWYYYIVAEDINAGYATDYASSPCAITIPEDILRITANPLDAEVDEGDEATFAVTASDALSYQWMVNKNDGNGWTAVEGANAAEYTISAADKDCDGFMYRCIVSDGFESVESEAAKLIVHAPTYHFVSFDTKGKGIVETQNVVSGGSVVQPALQTATGCVLDAWYTTDTYSADSKWDFATGTVQSNMTLYAKWLSTDAGIVSVSVNGTVGVIDGNKITVELPAGLVIPSEKSAVSVITVTGASCTSLSSADNGLTWIFTVLAEDAVTKVNYTVHVSAASNPPESGKPAESGEPAASDNPIASDEPAASDNPIASDEPAASDNPIASGEPAASDNPIASGTPMASGEPAASEGVDKGDVDGNGQIQLLDAQLALRAALRLTTLEKAAQKAADVDGDGTIGLKDAQKILRVALKLESAF